MLLRKNTIKYIRPRLHGCVFIWKRNDIFADSHPVYTETMKTIMKTQTFEYAIQIGFENAKKWKRNDMKTYPCNRGLKDIFRIYFFLAASISVLLSDSKLIHWIFSFQADSRGCSQLKMEQDDSHKDVAHCQSVNMENNRLFFERLRAQLFQMFEQLQNAVTKKFKKIHKKLKDIFRIYFFLAASISVLLPGSKLIYWVFSFQADTRGCLQLKMEQDDSYSVLAQSQSVKIEDIRPSFERLRAQLFQMFEHLQQNAGTKKYKKIRKKLDDIIMTGSIVKGTAIKCNHDIDVICKWQRTSQPQFTPKKQLLEKCIPALRHALVNIDGVFYIKDLGYGAKIMWEGESYDICAAISSIDLENLKMVDADDALFLGPSTGTERSKFVAGQEAIVKSSVMLIKLLRVHDTVEQFHVLQEATTIECDFIPSYAIELLVIYEYTSDKRVNLKCLTEKVLEILANIQPKGSEPKIIDLREKLHSTTSDSDTEQICPSVEIVTLSPFKIIDCIKSVSLDVLHKFRHWSYLRDSAERGLQYLKDGTFCERMYEAIHKHQLKYRNLNITTQPLPERPKSDAKSINFENLLKDEGILDIPPIWAVNTVTEPLKSSSPQNPDLSRNPAGSLASWWHLEVQLPHKTVHTDSMDSPVTLWETHSQIYFLRNGTVDKRKFFGGRGISVEEAYRMALEAGINTLQSEGYVSVPLLYARLASREFHVYSWKEVIAENHCTDINLDTQENKAVKKDLERKRIKKLQERYPIKVSAPKEIRMTTEGPMGTEETTRYQCIAYYILKDGEIENAIVGRRTKSEQGAENWAFQWMMEWMLWKGIVPSRKDIKDDLGNDQISNEAYASWTKRKGEDFGHTAIERSKK